MHTWMEIPRSPRIMSHQTNNCSKNHLRYHVTHPLHITGRKQTHQGKGGEGVAHETFESRAAARVGAQVPTSGPFIAQDTGEQVSSRQWRVTDHGH